MTTEGVAETRLVVRAVIAGVASACACTLYGLTSVHVKQQDVTIWFFDNRFLFFGPLSLPAGGFFGLALWRTIRGVRRIPPLGTIWLISCSLLAWHVAVYYAVIPAVQALDDVSWLPDLGKRAVFGIPAGAVGALCIVGSAAVLLKPLRSPIAVLAVTATGALAGCAAGLMSDPPLSVFPLFLAWQTGVLVVIIVFSARASRTSRLETS